MNLPVACQAVLLLLLFGRWASEVANSNLKPFLWDKVSPFNLNTIFLKVDFVALKVLPILHNLTCTVYFLLIIVAWGFVWFHVRCFYLCTPFKNLVSNIHANALCSREYVLLHENSAQWGLQVVGHFWYKVAPCLGAWIGFHTLKQHQLVSMSGMYPPFVMDWKLASLSYFCFGICPMVEPTPTCWGLKGLNVVVEICPMFSPVHL
jgi:hypothetical protein